MGLTLGSLFDGAGGFPLAGMMAGFEPVWASEVEPFPIRVTTKRIPQMRHLGDIRGLDGRSLEPVDVVTFGSPCQDLSVAGRREGLGGERSGLFREAVRVIREMREATNGRKPEFVVWENVPGAFSSNGGEDFRTVLEEVARIRDGGVSIPGPDGGRWRRAGEVVGDGFSIAWRTYDAQYWGVPQRRKRIYLVADFAGGRAGRVQFERESLLGNPAQGGGEGQGAARTPSKDAGAPVWAIQGSMIDRREKNGPQGSGINEGVCFTLNTMDRHAVAAPSESREASAVGRECLSDMGGSSIKVFHGVSGTLCGEGHRHAQVLVDGKTTGVVYGLSAKESNSWRSGNPHSGCYVAEATRTLDTRGGNPVCAQGGNIVVDGKAQEMPTYGVVSKGNGDCFISREYHTSLTSGDGEAGQGYPCVMQPYSMGNGQFADFGLDERARTLTCRHDPQMVIEPRGEEWPYRARKLTPLECGRLQGFPDGWCDGLGEDELPEEEVDWWMGVFEAHRRATKPGAKPKTRSQVRKWLESPRTDSAEYKMWGNSLAIPCAYTVLAGIAEALAESERG